MERFCAVDASHELSPEDLEAFDDVPAHAARAFMFTDIVNSTPCEGVKVPRSGH